MTDPLRMRARRYAAEVIRAHLKAYEVSEVPEETIGLYPMRQAQDFPNALFRDLEAVAAELEGE